MALDFHEVIIQQKVLLCHKMLSSSQKIWHKNILHNNIKTYFPEALHGTFEANQS